MRRETRMTLRKRKLPHQLRRRAFSVFDRAHDSIKVMTLHVSKGLEFPVGAGRMPTEGEDEREEARLFYVGATRATQRLVLGDNGAGNSLSTYRQMGRIHTLKMFRKKSLLYYRGPLKEVTFRISNC